MEGILGVDISASKVLTHERRFLWVGLAILGAAVPLVLALGSWFGRSLAAPIVALTSGTERIARGDLGHRVSVKGHDETQILAHSFNRMADSLQEAIAGRDVEIGNRTRAENALSVLNKDLEAGVQRLRRANEELQRFAFATAHDLKTPLRGIHVLADWLAADYADKLDERGREYLTLLAARTTRMYSLVEAVHQYTNIGYEESRVAVDLSELVPQVVNRLAPPKNVKITIEGIMPVIQYDRDRIAQVFKNLVDNAVRYMDKPQGCIVVRGEEEAGRWKFSVTDNGPGIERKYYEKVFEIFQTLSTKDESESTGMGLSIVKKIVESYGGEIWIDSILGEGTTFFFTLPKQTPAPVEPQRPAVEPIGSPN